jgi:Tfp pilus assembly protein PilZ
LALQADLYSFGVWDGQRTVIAGWELQVAEVNVSVTLVCSSANTYTSRSNNLSMGGIGVTRVYPPLRVGDKLTMHFTLPSLDEPLEVPGVVVWPQPNGMAGIRFMDVGKPASELLRNWLDHNRLLLPAGALGLPGLESDQPPATHSTNSKSGES